MDELLHVIAGRLRGTEIGADGLALDGKLNFAVGDILTHRGIKLVGLAAAPGRWSPTAIKEDHLDAIFVGELA